jgi:Ca2+-binding RTX toxin-like protein
MAVKIKFGTNAGDTIDYSSGPYSNYNLIVYGGKGNDLIKGGNMSDILVGGQGDDTIYGGLGNDILYGGDLIGGGGKNVLVGDTQDSAPIIGGTATYGNDLLLGGTGDDLLIGDRGGFYKVTTEIGISSVVLGHDILLGGSGNDILIGDFGFEKLNMMNRTMPMNSGGDILNGGAGDDVLVGVGYGAESLQGDMYNSETSNTSTFVGGDGNDIIVGEKFSWQIILGETLDGLILTPGTLFLNKFMSSDNMDGGSGNDFMAGDRANVVVKFTGYGLVGLFVDGNDSMSGGSGNDTLIGDRNQQNIFQSGTIDVSQLTTLKGADHLYGGAGNDVLVGDDSPLNSYYERGANVTVPGATVIGGTIATGHGTFQGNDTLQGGQGDDLIWGDNMTTAGGVNNTPTSCAPVAFNDPSSVGTFTAIASVSTTGVAVGSDTFVFDISQGWNRDVLMDFNGFSPNLAVGVGSPDTDSSQSGNNSVANTLWVQQDNLAFKNVAHVSGNTAIQDIDAQISSITDTSLEANVVNAGGYFARSTRSFVDPATNTTHTLDVGGASLSPAVYDIPNDRVAVHFNNGSTIVFADVVFTGQTSISQLYVLPTDAAAHISIIV